MTHTVKYSKTTLSGILMAGILVLSGCGNDADQGRDDSSETLSTADAPGNSESDAVTNVVLGELASVDGQIAVGDCIAVLVDVPPETWNVTNSNDEVVEVRGADSTEDVSIVDLVGIGPGEAVIVFEGEEDIRDEITVEVVDE